MGEFITTLFQGAYNQRFFDSCAFLSNAMTILIGTIAIYGLIKHRGTLSQFIKVLNLAYMTESARRIRDTLTKLERLSYDDKEHKKEIRALLGDLEGQLHTFGDQSEKVKNARNEVAETLTTPQKLTEAKKRRLVQVAHGSIDHSFQFSLQQIQDGKK